MDSTDADLSLDQRLAQRGAMQYNHPLEMKPTHANNQPRGNIPNTPLAVSTISFLLGTTFMLGFWTFCTGGLSDHWWSTYQIGFFVAAWALFHYGEFAVTAGWNREKCSVDCELPLYTTNVAIITRVWISLVVSHVTRKALTWLLPTSLLT